MSIQASDPDLLGRSKPQVLLGSRPRVIAAFVARAARALLPAYAVLYEAGRTSLAILVAAALLLAEASRQIRFVWLALALAQTWMLRSHESAAAADVGSAFAQMWLPTVLGGDLATWFDKLFVHPSLALPTLCVTAVVAMAATGSARRFWLAVFAA